MAILKESKEQRQARAFLLVVGEVARALSLVKRLPFLLARWRELCDWLKFRRLMIVDWRELCHWSVNFVINGDFRLNKGFTHGKFFVHPLVNLCLNVQFWSAHHVHGTKLHPKRGSCDMNSIEVKSFEIPNVPSRSTTLNRYITSGNMYSGNNFAFFAFKLFQNCTNVYYLRES